MREKAQSVVGTATKSRKCVRIIAKKGGGPFAALSSMWVNVEY